MLLHFGKIPFLLILLIMLIPIAHSATATSLTITKSPDVFEQPELPYTLEYEAGELSMLFDAWNETSEQYEFFDGCLEGYGTGGYNFYEVTNYSCMDSTFLEETELDDKTILKNLHWFDDTGTYKKTGMAIFAKTATRYYAYFWYGEFDEVTDTHYRRFYYVPDLEYITTTAWGTQIYQSNDAFGATDEVWYFDDPVINKTGILKKIHAYDYEFAVDDCSEHRGWGYYVGNASVAWMVSSATQVCGGSGSPISTSQHNFNAKYDTATAITPNIFLRVELNATSLGGNQGRLFYSGIRYRVDDPTDCSTCQTQTATKANDEMMYLRYYNPIRQNEDDYTGERAKVIAIYIDTSTGLGINGATCTGTKTYYKKWDYNPSANQFVTKTYTATEDFLNDGYYFIYFMDDEQGEDQPVEDEKYTFTFSCSKGGFDSKAGNINIWLSERGGYQEEDRFRFVSMEDVFDTVSAYDPEGTILDISDLRKDQLIKQVIFRIYERDVGYVRNTRMHPNQTVAEYKEFMDIDDDETVYAIGVRVWADDFYCSGDKAKYRINPSASYWGTEEGYASLASIGTSNFGFDANLNPTSFCLGTRTGGTRIVATTESMNLGDRISCLWGAYSFLECETGTKVTYTTVQDPTVTRCHGFKCSEPTKAYMQIKICEEGSVIDCTQATLTRTLEFEFAEGRLEFKYPQVINIDNTTQKFYGRLYSTNRDVPVVFGMDNIDCTANVTGADSSNIVIGQLEPSDLDALSQTFNPTVAQRSNVSYNYSLYCDAEQAGFQNLYQTGVAYVGDFILGQSRCGVIPDRFRPNTYVTTYCELGASTGDTKLLDNFTIQYNASLGTTTEIKNLSTLNRLDYKVWEYSDFDYYRNNTGGMQTLEDGNYLVRIFGEDGNGNYPSFEQYLNITVDSNLIDVDSYLMSVWDNVPPRGYYQTGDEYSCSVKWKDPDRKLFRATVEVSTVLDSEEFVHASEVFRTRQDSLLSGVTLPLFKESQYKDIYDVATFDPLRNTYTLDYNMYDPLDVCDARGDLKLFNASAFATSDIFLRDVCENFPVRERDNIKCTWTFSFGTNISGISGNKSVQHSFRRLESIDLWAFLGAILEGSGISALFGNIGDWIKSNLLMFIFIIVLIVLVSIVVISQLSGDNGGNNGITVAPAQIGGRFE